MRLIIPMRALLSHWVRRPVQISTLLLGLSLATGLWTGVQAINTEARHSYTQAADQVSGGNIDSLIARDGSMIPVQTFVDLQRAGWRTSPVLEGIATLAGETFNVVGIEPLSLPKVLAGLGMENDRFSLPDFLSPQGLIIASSKTAGKLAQGGVDIPVVTGTGIADNSITVDIAVAARLLNKPHHISRLILWPDQRLNTSDLETIAPSLILKKARASGDLDRLTDSFHLNLTAFGLLAFAVGLFIVHGAIELAFEQRRALFRTLRVLGLSISELAVALCLELLALALVAGVAGIVMGYLVASLLLPDVALTLRGLYGAELAGDLSFRVEWWGSGLAITVIGTFVAAFGSLRKLIRLPVLASAQSRAWSMHSDKSGRVLGVSALFLGGAAIVVYGFGSGLIAGFAVVGAALLASAFLLPVILSSVLGFAGKRMKHVIGQWFLADTRQQVPGLMLALMALLVALAVNIGVSTMVGSFRSTFNGWLNQRLASELYIRADNADQAKEITRWLNGRADAVLPIWNVDARLLGVAGKIYGFADHETYRNHWPILAGTVDLWDQVRDGKAALINEQLARREGIAIGDQVDLGEGRGLPVAGIYSDYGNPQPQAMVNTRLLQKWYPGKPQLRFAIRINEQRALQLAAQLRSEFDLDAKAVVDQSSIKAQSISIFERTFAVTSALNILTLAVAGVAMFTSLLTMATMRVPQLAPVWALGLTRKQLAWLELLRSLLFAMMTIILALPAGLLLAWLLLAVVNVEAFGWKLPMQLFVGDWLRLSVSALIATVVASAIPAWRLGHTAPSDLVKVFANER